MTEEKKGNLWMRGNDDDNDKSSSTSLDDHQMPVENDEDDDDDDDEDWDVRMIIQDNTMSENNHRSSTTSSSGNMRHVVDLVQDDCIQQCWEHTLRTHNDKDARLLSFWESAKEHVDFYRQQQQQQVNMEYSLLQQTIVLPANQRFLNGNQLHSIYRHGPYHYWLNPIYKIKISYQIQIINIKICQHQQLKPMFESCLCDSLRKEKHLFAINLASCWFDNHYSLNKSTLINILHCV